MKSQIIRIGCGYGDEIAFFPLRVITLAEENTFLKRFADIADSETAEKKSTLEFDILVDGLAAWTAEMPVKKDGDSEIHLVEDADSPAAAVRSFFAEQTAEKERIANQLVMSFRMKLAPTVIFQ